MALTYSSMLELGTKLPDFTLTNTLNDQEFDSESLSSDRPKVIMFICNHCPYVIHYHDQLVSLYDDYKDKVEFVAISSNDADNYPQDGPTEMKGLFSELGLDFPYLYDETQEIAKKYQAQCTPEFYLFDDEDKLIYRGRMDGSSPGSGNPTGADLRNAIDNFLAGREISDDQRPSMGCNIKWK